MSGRTHRVTRVDPIDAHALVTRVEGRLDRVGTATPGEPVPSPPLTPQHRVLIGIAGSPGAGKSTLARAVVDALTERGLVEAAYLPMDGFHLANATLDRLGRRARKGAIDTFDGWGFVALLERLRTETGHTVYAPSFERELDEPVAAEIVIEASARVVIVEGNYLLCDEEPWGRVRGLLDETWFCDAPEPERMARLVARHIAGGRTRDEAEAYARDIDGANARIIEATRERADVVVSGSSSVQ